MVVYSVRPLTNGQRHKDFLKVEGLSKQRPERNLIQIIKKTSGRNNSGRITVRHRGGQEKRYYRMIDFRRDKKEVVAVVNSIEYDPNRTANIALLFYVDGEKRYILAPDGLKVGDKIMSSEQAEIKVGNSLPLKSIPLGMQIHNIELTVGKGGQLARSAGAFAVIQSREGRYANVLLGSSEVRKVLVECYATIGQVSNPEWQNLSLGKAGRKRHMGWRPSVRGTAMAPNSHPHGGGEGRSGVGMSTPKSVYGKRVGGIKTRNKKKYSNKFILERRKK